MTRAILLDANGCKPCSKCKEVKHFSLFSRRPEVKSGFKSHCRECARTDRAAERERAPDLVAARAARSYAKEKAKGHPASRRYAKTEKGKEAARVCRQKHKAKAAERGERWRKSNLAKFAKKAKRKTDNLHDSYVRCALRLRKAEHPQEDLLIAMKREAISLKRATRAAKTQLKETS